ncbi:MAG: hypothetical protein U0183_24980 [Polyangiaceae bacterium]
MSLDAEAEDVAFAMEPVKGVLAVMKIVPPVGKLRFVVELDAEHAAYAKGHATMRLLRLGLRDVDVELLVWGAPARWTGRLEPVTLDEHSRERARERTRARALLVEARRTDDGCYLPRADFLPQTSYDDVPRYRGSYDETLAIGPVQVAAASQHWFGPTRHIMALLAAESALESRKHDRVLVDMSHCGSLLRKRHLFAGKEVFVITTRDDLRLAERAAHDLPTRARVLVRPLERQRPPYGPFAPFTEHERLQAEFPVLLHDPTGLEEVPTVRRIAVVVTRTLAGALRALDRNDFAAVVIDATSRTDGQLDYRLLWENMPHIKTRTRLLVTQAQADALLARGLASGKALPVLVRPLREHDLHALVATARRKAAFLCLETSRCAHHPRPAAMPKAALVVPT